MLKLINDAPQGEWSLDAFQGFLKEWLVQNNVKMKDVGLPLRAALTGTKQSPSIVDVVVALGRVEAQQRIEQTCKKQGFAL